MLKKFSSAKCLGNINQLFSIIAFSALGIFGNFAKLEMFFNVDFLFGGIFVILAIKYYGKCGIIAGFIASLYTYVLWNHPYAIVIFSVEAAFIAFSLNRDRDIIITDMLYWATIGFALIVIFYHFVMGMDYPTTLLISIKQGVNGVFNTLAASLIYHGVNYLAKVRGYSYKQIYIKHIFFKLLFMTAAIPALIYVIYTVRHHSKELSEEYIRRLETMNNAATISISNFFNDANMQTAMMSGHIVEQLKSDNLEPQEMKGHIVNLINSSNIFKGIAYIDKDFMAKSMFVKKNDKIVDMSGADFKNRNYFAETSAKNGTFFADMHSCKGELQIISALRAVRDEKGNLRGYVQGGIDIITLRNIVLKLTETSGVYHTLIDREGSIIFTTNPEYANATKYVDRRSNGVVQYLNSDVYQWTPRPLHNVAVMTRWKNSYYVKSNSVSDTVPYKIISELPLAGYVKNANSTGFSALIIIALMIVFAMFTALIFSRRAASHFTRLADNTFDLPGKVHRNEPLEWKGSVFVEVNQLVENFRSMGKELSESFARLKQQADELTLVLNSIPLIVFVKDTRNNVILGNKAAADCFGLAVEDLANRPVSDLLPEEATKYYEDDLTVIRTGQPLFKIIQSYRLLNGLRTVITDKIPILNSYGDVESILVISVDITEELKQQEEKTKTIEILYQQSKMAEMGAMIGAITHQWKQPLNAIGLLAQVIYADAEEENVDKEAITTNAKLILDNVGFMSQTVSDFSSFYKTSKECQAFKACETMQEIYLLIDRQFRQANITVTFHDHEHFEVFGLKNEFKQVCLNLLNNAKEVLIASDKSDKSIDIKYSKTVTHGRITIADNGGGISEEMLNSRLFEMSTTSKENGTGIGLYICKIIVEEHMGGTITARNTEDGAEFTITVPLNNA